MPPRGKVKKTQTKTRVVTNTITRTKMATATLALFFATGLAFLAAPLENTQLQVAVDPRCGIETYQVVAQCGEGKYRRATVSCSDGYFAVFGTRSTCFSLTELQAKAESACLRRCNVHIAQPVTPVSPLITIASNKSTPLGTNVLMGSVDEALALFDFTASNQEDITLQDLVVSFHLPNAATSSVRNIRLYDQLGIQIGSAVGSLESQGTSTFAHAKFHNINFKVQKNKTETLTVKADIATYDQLPLSGVRFQPVILTSDTDITALNSSGKKLEHSQVSFQTQVRGNVADGTIEDELLGKEKFLPVPGNVEANQFIAYRAKMILQWAPQSPSGMTSPSSAQVVGKVVVSNLSNSGDYTASLQTLNFSLTSSIVNQSERSLNIIRDAFTNRPLATTNFNPLFLEGQSSFNTSTGFSDPDFPDVDIAPGVNKFFFITLDTTEAVANQTLGISIPAWNTYSQRNPRQIGVLWTEGVVRNIVAHGNTLPLEYKTLSY